MISGADLLASCRSDYPEFAEVPEGEASDFEEDLPKEEEEVSACDGRDCGP